MQRVKVIDSHTGGEPTRVVIEGGPELGCGSLWRRRDRFRLEHDAFRSAVVQEPRGSEVWVGALLVEPEAADCVAGVIFFNNVGYLGMCGHGLMGVLVTLAHLGRVTPGRHRVDTPAGAVSATLQPDGSVSVDNVASYRQAAGVEIAVPGRGRVRGDVAYGGNWFFLAAEPRRDLRLDNVGVLTEEAWRIRQAVNAAGFPEVDHIELFGPPTLAKARARNFVLCPGKAYDRSPCGTGTSAKLACLAVDGDLTEDELWVQEGIVGSRFEARYRWLDRERGVILPTIAGTAYLTAEATLRFDERDPFRHGLG